MTRAPVIVTLQLDRIHCHLSDDSDQPGDRSISAPYLWVVFFKIDGDTVAVSEAPKLVGPATVVGTPGSHGNLGRATVRTGEIVPIPVNLGRWRTVLRPIMVPAPVKPLIGDDLGGIVGVVFILMEEDLVSHHGAEAGHSALNEGIRFALNDIITQLGPTKTEPTEQDISQYFAKIEDDIRTAIENAQDSWADFLSWLNPDDVIGREVMFWKQDDLVRNPTSVIDKLWESNGKWQLLGHIGLQRIQSNDVLASYDGIIDIAGSYNYDDTYRAVLVATRNGDVREIFYHAFSSSEMPNGIGDSSIAHFDGIIGLAGFYNEDDNFRVAIVATSDGNIWEVFYHPLKGKGQSIIAHFDGIVDIAGFYAVDDSYRIVLVATKNEVHEVFYHPDPTKGKGQGIIGRYDNIVAISGYYARNTRYRSLRVATKDGRLHYLFYHPHLPWSQGVNIEGNMISLANNDKDQFIVTQDGKVRKLVPGGLRIDLATISGIEHIAVDHWDSNNLIYSTNDGKLHKLLW